MSNKIKFVNLDAQEADQLMLQKFLSNALLGSILKTKSDEYFLIIENREPISETDFASIFCAYTLQKSPDETIGFIPIARLTTHETSKEGTPYCFFISTIFVDQKYQNRGIGSCILDFLTGLSSERGFVKMELNAIENLKISKTNGFPININYLFYVKNGFHAISEESESHITHMSKIILPSDKNRILSQEHLNTLINQINQNKENNNELI